MAPSLKPAAHSLALGKWLLREDLSRSQQVAIFQRWVAEVSVETNGFCNRACWFCANHFLNRRGPDLVMAPERWEIILRDLHDIGYRRVLGWSRFSEPLADRTVLERIAEAHAAVPDCRIAIFSNGDYLDEEYLGDLRTAGVRRLAVGAYLPEGTAFTRAAAWERCAQIASQCAATYQILADREDRVTLRLEVPGLKATVACLNFGVARETSDRGGTLPAVSARKPRRVSPCYLPIWHLVVDYNGAVPGCCHLRSDYPGHEKAVVARIGLGEGETGLVEAYSRMAPWRRALMTYDPKPPPCEHCTAGPQATDPVTRLGQRLARGVAGCTSLGLGASLATPFRANHV